MYNSIRVSRTLTEDDLEDFLWSYAKDRWINATESTRHKVWNRICEYASVHEDNIGDCVTETWVDDLVWFDCDDLFYPESDEDEDLDEDDCDEDSESAAD